GLIERTQPVRRGAQALLRIGLGEGGSGKLARSGVFEPLLADRRQDLAFGAESRVDRARRNAGLGGDGLHARRAVTPGGEQPARRRGDALARLLGLYLAIRDRRIDSSGHVCTVTVYSMQ